MLMTATTSARGQGVIMKDGDGDGDLDKVVVNQAGMPAAASAGGAGWRSNFSRSRLAAAHFSSR